MNLTQFLCLVLLCSGVMPAFGCLNTSETNEGESEIARRRSTSAAHLQESLNRDLKLRGAEMEERLRGGSDFTNRNDYAVALIFVGRNEEAIRLLEELEKERPGNYVTAANLGTAYELGGQNALALKWIQEGMRRNPVSHQGTEWIHVKILEAKLRQEQEPDYFKTHSVLDLNPAKSKASDSLVTLADRELSAAQVADAIHYQLKERLQFVKQPDPAVASLLFDYGVVEALTGSVENARELLKLAVKFGYPETKVRPLYAQFDTSVRLGIARKMALYTGAGFALGFLIICAIKKRWITLTRS